MKKLTRRLTRKCGILILKLISGSKPIVLYNPRRDTMLCLLECVNCRAQTFDRSPIVLLRDLEDDRLVGFRIKRASQLVPVAVLKSL